MQLIGAARTIQKIHCGLPRSPHDDKQPADPSPKSVVRLQSGVSLMLIRCLMVAMAYLPELGASMAVSEARAGGGSHLYVNAEYGFSVRIPSGQPTCRAEPNTHDTGIMIFLDRGPADCAKRNQRPFVAVNGTYNATDASSALEALTIACGSAKPQSTDMDVFGDLKKTWPVMCRIQPEEGFVEYLLIRQNPPMEAGATPSINYSIVVNIPTSDPNQKLKDARTILKSVHLKSSG
jgi:hypothetical protein